MYANVSLRSLTSFRIGGKALVAFVDDVSQLSVLCDEPFVLGNGTNVLASECISRPVAAIRLTRFSFDDVVVTAESGVSLAALSREAALRGLTGLEWATGIPGSVGGALRMNAGAFGSELGQIVETVNVLEDGRVLTLTAEECGFLYRGSSFRGVAVEARLRLKRGERGEIERKMREYAALRRLKQPVGASAGSVYKRAERAAGWYIERAGLKGERKGDAVVSVKHANFIINEGNATARDVLSLMERIEKRVYESFGVRLEREIELLGDF